MVLEKNFKHCIGLYPNIYKFNELLQLKSPYSINV